MTANGVSEMNDRWICSVCGYIHKGPAPPESCPSCGAPFTAFERREADPKRRYRRIQIVEKRPQGFKYLIVGNSAAGRTAAQALSAMAPDASITILSEEQVGLYARPILPDFIGGMDREDCLSTGAHFDDKGLEIVKGVVAVSIDRVEKTVTCGDGSTYPYDALLIATGSSPIQIPWPGSDAEGIAYFRTFADAERIAQAASNATHAVVVGGGLLGLEFIRAFHMRKIPTTHLVREARVGAPALDEKAGGVIERALADWGVEVILEDEVESFESTDGRVSAVRTKGGKTIECDLVGVAVGVKPRVELAREAGLRVDRGIIVNRRFQSSDPSIYAAGDVAQAFDQVWNESRVNTSWRNSTEQGDHAGIYMAGGEGEYAGAVAANFQLAAGRPFCAIGISNPADEAAFEIEASVDMEKRTYRKLIRRDGVLVGACLVGDLGESREIEDEIRASTSPMRSGAGQAAPARKDPDERETKPGGPEPPQEEAGTMRKMTEENVKAAFAGESQAHMKYLNFAVKAADEGMTNVARLFRAASFAEQVHASAHLEVLGGIGSTADNLAEAADGENFEVEEMYPAFMVVAEDQEEFEAHQSFANAYEAEKQHHEFYVKAKEAVNAGSDVDLGIINVCSVCGCTLEGEAPKRCPVCGAKKEEFVQF